MLELGALRLQPRFPLGHLRLASLDFGDAIVNAGLVRR